MAEHRGVDGEMKSIIHSLTYSLDYLVEQVADVDDDVLTTQPNGVTNHPAWTMGHLAYALQLIGTVVGLEMSLPEGWAERYGPGSRPVADPGVYESREKVIEILSESRDRIVSAAGHLDDAALDRPFPDPSFLDVFPTVRHALTQVLLGHTAFHIGQIAAWRSAMGLESVGRSYE